jgi:hypothetical protein
LPVSACEIDNFGATYGPIKVVGTLLSGASAALVMTSAVTTSPVRGFTNGTYAIEIIAYHFVDVITNLNESVKYESDLDSSQ